MEAGAAQPLLPIAPARFFGDFLAVQKVTRRRSGEILSAFPERKRTDAAGAIPRPTEFF